jgi:hypothetical protein
VHIWASAGIADLTIVGAIENREMPYPCNRAERRAARKLVNRWALPEVFGRLERDEQRQQCLGHAQRKLKAAGGAFQLVVGKEQEIPRTNLASTIKQIELTADVIRAAEDAKELVLPYQPGPWPATEWAGLYDEAAAKLRDCLTEQPAAPARSPVRRHCPDTTAVRLG